MNIYLPSNSWREKITIFFPHSRNTISVNRHKICKIIFNFYANTFFYFIKIILHDEIPHANKFFLRAKIFYAVFEKKRKDEAGLYFINLCVHPLLVNKYTFFSPLYCSVKFTAMLATLLVIHERLIFCNIPHFS